MGPGGFFGAVVLPVAIGVLVGGGAVGRAELLLPPTVGNAVAEKIRVQQVHALRTQVDRVEGVLPVAVAQAPRPVAQIRARQIAVVGLHAGRCDHAADQQVRDRFGTGRVERSPRQRRFPAARPPVRAAAAGVARRRAFAVELGQLRVGHGPERIAVGADIPDALPEVVAAGPAQVEIGVRRPVPVGVAQEDRHVHRLGEAHVVQEIQRVGPAVLVPQRPGVVRQRVEAQEQHHRVVAAADVHPVAAHVQVRRVHVEPDPPEIAEPARILLRDQRRPFQRQIDVVADVVGRLARRVVGQDRRARAGDRRRRPAGRAGARHGVGP